MPSHRVLSLGAGVQSSCLLLMSCKGMLPKLDAAVFADTDAEPEEVYRWLDMLKGEAAKAGIEVITVSNGSLERDIPEAVAKGVRCESPPLFVEGKGGRASMTTRKCTRHYKVRAVRRGIREACGLGARERFKGLDVEQWIGFSLDEAERVSATDEHWLLHAYPLLDLGMSRADCKRWMKDEGFGDAPRSACVFCPYHSDTFWARMKADDPESFRRACAWDEGIRPGLQGSPGEAFTHRKLQPLRRIKFEPDKDEHPEQLPLFGGGQCEGMCGY